MQVRQKGAALITGLLILFILTMIAISSMQTTLLQDKMVGAIRDSQIAMEGAESAARDAETFIESQSTLGAFNNTKGLYSTGNTPGSYLADWAGATDAAISTKAGAAVTGLSSAPRYFIEHIGEVAVTDDVTDINITTLSHDTGSGNVQGFRIVSRSTGATGDSQRMIESYYGKRF